MIIFATLRIDKNDFLARNNNYCSEAKNCFNDRRKEFCADNYINFTESYRQRGDKLATNFDHI